MAFICPNHNHRVIMRIYFIALVAFLFCACGNAGASGEQEPVGDSDSSVIDSSEPTLTDTACDTSGFNVIELVSTSQVLPSPELLFNCPQTIDEPVDALPYADVDYIWEFNNYLREMAMGYYDPACLECCQFETDDQIGCVQATCAVSGADVLYRYEKYAYESRDADESSNYYDREILEIVPEAGSETWTRLELEIRWDHKVWQDGGDELQTRFAVHWEGSIRDEWPSDYRVGSTVEDVCAHGYCWIKGTWDHETCSIDTWRQDDLLLEPGLFDSFRFENDTLKLSMATAGTDYLATVNDVCVGHIDGTTWEITAPCP